MQVQADGRGTHAHARLHTQSPDSVIGTQTPAPGHFLFLLAELLHLSELALLRDVQVKGL